MTTPDSIKNLQWISDDYVFGTTMKTLYSKKKYISIFKSSSSIKTNNLNHNESNEKRPLIKLEKIIAPEEALERVKIANFRQRKSESKLPQFPLIKLQKVITPEEALERVKIANFKQRKSESKIPQFPLINFPKKKLSRKNFL